MKSTLISVAELAALPASDVLVVDCRHDLADAGKGERDYRAEHIPGAVFASLDHDLSDLTRTPLGLGRHPLPLEQSFSATLGRWGWRPGLQVVCYDAGNGALAAARLWWLLRLCGVQEVAVLDGGYTAWKAAGRPVTSQVTQREPTQVSLHYDASQMLLDHAAVAKLKQDLLLDARAAPRYLGEVEPLDRAAGHVPGAANRPFSDNLQADGRFKSAEALRQEFLAVIGQHKPEQVVHMCGSGVTACHNMLAMEHAGLAGSRLYAPSWSGWVSDPSRPIAVGANRE
ncbi:sulfurtransferase [Dyella flava]|uniref:Sulfurtransferase n=1 Tax=Dyella flava TaxID=1920170 RepID=A0ABS2K3Y8_9GAMM|nr:sulfurtransferase [Dyella flava]MBM7125958.1 sulfurtransferase [Dyella flava]GLQ52299.1 sulfurtransferase [Dyella flava]